ncbi:MAG: radical SAM protein [Desulfuromonadaceae bacterium]
MRIVFPTLHVRRSAQAVSLAAGCLRAALPQEWRERSCLLDFYPQQDSEEMLRKILGLEPQLVAFPLYVWNRSRVCELALLLRRRNPSLLLIAGGPEVYADPEGVLTQGGFDAVIRGEGEEVFRDLIRRFLAGQNGAPIAGLHQAAGAGEEMPEPAPPRLEDLPSPWLSGSVVPTADGGVLWETSRGCPFACTFCFDGRGRRGTRFFPMERLEQELDLFVRHQVSQVWVLDSTFNYPAERGKQLLRLLRRKAPHIHFHLEAKAEFLDRATARLLSQLICSVQIGLQSSCPEVLKQIGRNFDPEKFTRRIHLLASEGVTFGFDLIYGLPGDDYAGFCRSLNFALTLAPNHIDIFPLAVLPGTRLHQDVARFGLRAQAEPPYEILQSDSLSPVELEDCRLLAAATDLFYNTGRAVGFFLALVKATGMDAVGLLQDFTQWLLAGERCSRERLLDTQVWRPEEALRLQEQFLTELFKRRQLLELLPAVLDLLRYHYHYAETLLGPEALPMSSSIRDEIDPWKAPLRIAEGVRLVPFAYEILDLIEMGEVDFEQLMTLFRPVGSVAIFFRRGEQVFCESLEEDFLTLLRGCTGDVCAADIFAGSIAAAEGEEIVRFALAEGFLLPASDSTVS